MKNLFFISIIALVFLQACDKGEPVDGNNAKITLTGSGPGFVTSNVTVNPGDSLFFDYTVTSDMDMKFVSIQKNPVNQTAFVVRDTLSAANAHSYSATKRLRADSINGSWVYRISAHNEKGVYIGHKDVIVTVNPDFYYYTMRIMQVPDTVEKSNNAFLSATTGRLFSYTTGSASSDLIDFGIYYDTTGRSTASTTDDSLFCFYALTAPPPKYVNIYDFSGWATKNPTALRRVTSPAFNTLTSGGALRTAANTNLSGANANIRRVTGVGAGGLVFFRTAAGKAGCLQLIYAGGNTAEKSTYALVDVKIER